MIADMRIAAKEDRELNDRGESWPDSFPADLCGLSGQPSTKKIGLLRHVMHNLTKVELQLAFIEANLLSVMTDWMVS